MTEFILCIAFFVALAIAINHYFVRNFPERLITVTYAVTVVLFLLGGLTVGASFPLEKKINEFVNTELLSLRSTIDRELYSAGFPKEGFPIDDIDKIQPFALEALSKVNPEGFLGSIVFSRVSSHVQNIIDDRVSSVKFFSRNGFITIDSIADGIMKAGRERIAHAFLIVRLIVSGILLLYAVYCCVTANEEKKKRRNTETAD